MSDGRVNDVLIGRYLVSGSLSLYSCSLCLSVMSAVASCNSCTIHRSCNASLLKVGTGQTVAIDHWSVQMIVWDSVGPQSAPLHKQYALTPRSTIWLSRICRRVLFLFPPFLGSNRVNFFLFLDWSLFDCLNRRQFWPKRISSWVVYLFLLSIWCGNVLQCLFLFLCWCSNICFSKGVKNEVFYPAAALLKARHWQFRCQLVAQFLAVTSGNRIEVAVSTLLGQMSNCSGKWCDAKWCSHYVPVLFCLSNGWPHVVLCVLCRPKLRFINWPHHSRTSNVFGASCQFKKTNKNLKPLVMVCFIVCWSLFVFSLSNGNTFRH